MVRLGLRKLHASEEVQLLFSSAQGFVHIIFAVLAVYKSGDWSHITLCSAIHPW
jgi:hypothetical protein